MTLLTRLVAPLPGEQKIPVHQFLAAIAEFQRGAPGVTPAAIQAVFGLAGAELSALTAWYTAQWATGNVNRQLVHDVLMLGEGGQYTLAQVQARLNLT